MLKLPIRITFDPKLSKPKGRIMFLLQKARTLYWRVSRQKKDSVPHVPTKGRRKQTMRFKTPADSWSYNTKSSIRYLKEVIFAVQLAVKAFIDIGSAICTIQESVIYKLNMMPVKCQETLHKSWKGQQTRRQPQAFIENNSRRGV